MEAVKTCQIDIKEGRKSPIDIIKAYKKLREEEKTSIFELIYDKYGGEEWYKKTISEPYLSRNEEENGGYDSFDEELAREDAKNAEELKQEGVIPNPPLLPNSNKVNRRLEEYGDGVYARSEIIRILRVLHKEIKALKEYKRERGEDLKEIIYIATMCIKRYNQRQRHVPLIPGKNRYERSKYVDDIINKCRKILDPKGGLQDWSRFGTMKLSKNQEKYWENEIRKKYPTSTIVRQLKILNGRPDIVDMTRKVIYECKLGYMAFRQDQYETYKGYRKYYGYKIIYLFYEDSIMIKSTIYSKRDIHEMSLRPIKRHKPKITSVKVDEIISYL